MIDTTKIETILAKMKKRADEIEYEVNELENEREFLIEKSERIRSGLEALEAVKCFSFE